MTTKTTYEGAENGNLYFAVREGDTSCYSLIETPASTPVAPARGPLTPEYVATLDAQGQVLANHEDSLWVDNVVIVHPYLS